MIEEIAVYLPDGNKLAEIMAGENGVKKIFFDKDDLSTLVITRDEDIVTYHGFLYVAKKAYKVTA